MQHFLPLEVLGAVKSKGGDHHPFVVCVVTDYEAHALWMEPAVDLHCVAADETKARLVARKIDGARVAVTGIPIAARFATPIDAAAVRRRLGLRDDLPTVLVLGGGFGMGPMEDILAALDAIDREFQADGLACAASAPTATARRTSVARNHALVRIPRRNHSDMESPSFDAQYPSVRRALATAEGRSPRR